MADKNRKNRKNSTASKSTQSLLAAGLALIVADQVLAAVGQNSGEVFKGKGTQPLDKQIPVAEALLVADAPVEDLLSQAEDTAFAERVSATVQAASEDLLIVSADAVVLEVPAELGSALAEAQLAELPPHANELLLAQADIGASGAGETAAAGGASAAAISPLAILGAVAGIGLAAGGAGGAGGGGGGGATNTGPGPQGVGGPAAAATVVDGYLAGSTVTRADGSGNSVTTDAKGGFTGLTGTGAIRVSGGIDQSTGQKFTGVLYAPEGSGAITPLTTLVNSLVSSGMSANDAKAAVLAKLGLPAGFDLLNADPVALAAAGDMNAFAVLKAGSAIATLLQTLSNGDPTAFGTVANALAKLLNDSSGQINFADADFLKKLVAESGVPFAGSFEDLVAGLIAIGAATSLAGMARAQAETLTKMLGFDEYEPAGLTKIGASLVGLAGMGLNHGVAGAAGDSFLIQGGIGGIGAATLDSLGLSFAQNLDVMLDLQAGDAATDGVVDSTIQLNSSLAGLAGLGIDHITGDAGQDVTITGGLGNIGLNTVESLGLSFAQNLDVTLDLQAADANMDAIADGTIQLNSSLAGLAGLGIDHITGDAGQHVTVMGGVGGNGFDLDALAAGGFGFADNLNVALQVGDGDMATADGTIQLNSSLTGLAGLGIDHITGDAGQDVFINGGLGNNAALTALAAGGFGFGNNLDVTLGGLNAAALDNYSGGAGALAGWSGATTDLAAIGVDTISVGTADVSLDDISALISSGLDFAGADNISFIDASVEGTLMAGGHGITLDDLADLGIDTIDADADAVNTFTLVAGGDVADAMSSVDLEKALADILAKFDGAVFADEDLVSLDIGDNATAVAGLGQAFLSEIELLGIDSFSNGGDEIWNKNTTT